MALLSADDVLNKTFQSVKFREGYDQIEVDEFLDEVVATIYALTVENAELKEKLADAEQRVQSLQSGQVSSEAPVVVEEAPTEVVEAVVEEEPVPEEPQAAPEAPADAVPLADPQAATSMLALAQRLHDEYVNDGKEEGERIVAEARAEAKEIVDGANRQRDDILTKLQGEQASLEDTINNLRGFEADYRSSISDHLRKLLDDLKTDSGE